MTEWRKSSYSSTASNCVEVAFESHRVGVRDSKNTTPTITVSDDAWRSFRSTLRDDRV